MKHILTTLLLFVFSSTYAQQDTANHNPVAINNTPSFVKQSTLITLSVGFIDPYRSNYSLPSGFSDGSSSGFNPVYLKAEYAVGLHIGIGVNFIYDNFYYTYAQNYQNNGTTYPRYLKDDMTVYGGGLALYYHLADIIPIRKLDVFIGAGGSLNHIGHTDYPQADSTGIYVTHTITPVLKIGARYYISRNASVYADAGYDQLSIFSVGFSCRIFSKKQVLP